MVRKGRGGAGENKGGLGVINQGEARRAWGSEEHGASRSFAGKVHVGKKDCGTFCETGR